MRIAGDKWMRWVGLGLVLFSGLTALAVLLLPLLLVLLMLLFDNTAHGVLVLLDLLFGWLRDLLAGPDDGSAPSQFMLHPLDVALAALARALPCLAGLAVILFHRAPGRSWWLVVLAWSASAAAGGQIVATLLLPGIVAAMLFARAGSPRKCS